MSGAKFAGNSFQGVLEADAIPMGVVSKTSA